MKPGSLEWIAWVYSEAAEKWPQINRSSFCFDDPWLLFDHLINNDCRISPKPGDLVMDVGANRGIVTLMCALKGANVVAYEPTPIAFNILQDTIRRNNIQDRVQAINAALHTSSGTVVVEYNNIFEHQQNEMVVNGRIASGESDPRESKREVLAVSFEEAIGDREWDCVKMDIEGFEFPLLLECPDTVFGKIRYLTLELHFDGVSRETYNRLIARLERFFFVEGVMNGENCYQALFARAR